MIDSIFGVNYGHWISHFLLIGVYHSSRKSLNEILSGIQYVGSVIINVMVFYWFMLYNSESFGDLISLIRLVSGKLLIWIIEVFFKYLFDKRSSIHRAFRKAFD